MQDNEWMLRLRVLVLCVVALAVAGAEQILMREVDQAAHKEVLDKISATL